MAARCSTGDSARELGAWHARDAQMARILLHVIEVCLWKGVEADLRVGWYVVAQVSHLLNERERFFATEIEYLLPDHGSMPTCARQHDRNDYASTHSVSSARILLTRRFIRWRLQQCRRLLLLHRKRCWTYLSRGSYLLLSLRLGILRRCRCCLIPCFCHDEMSFGCLLLGRLR